MWQWCGNRSGIVFARAVKCIDDILEWYDGLDREQVKAVIDFAVRSLDTPAPGR